MTALLTIGELASRSGVAAPTLRFYETEGLIHSERTPAGHRRYPREVLRRVAFIRAAQSVGIGLAEAREAMDRLGHGRAPTPEEWADLSEQWRERLDRRIELLMHLRDELDSCIGCGCLSLQNCALYNPHDRAATKGPGARFLLGDRP